MVNHSEMIYGCENIIWFLALTDSAASLLNRVTIHKDLGIKIGKTDGRGKENWAVRNSNKNYIVLVSIKIKATIRIPFFTQNRWSSPPSPG